MTAMDTIFEQGPEKAKETLFSALSVDWDEICKSESLSPITVAVVDSGVDSSHPDLMGRVTASWGVEAYPENEPCRIIPVARPGNNDPCGHGTAVAGIICEMAPNVSIIDIRVLDNHNRGTGRQLVAGLDKAIDSGARVINMSLACKKSFSTELGELCEMAYKNNQIIVAAKRNIPLTDNGYPAELSSCIPVDMADFSTPFVWHYRPKHPIEWIGRGENITCLAAGGGYVQYTGTSFATPAISGLVALLLGRFPELRPYEVKTLLKALAENFAQE